MHLFNAHKNVEKFYIHKAKHEQKKSGFFFRRFSAGRIFFFYVENTYNTERKERANKQHMSKIIVLQHDDWRIYIYLKKTVVFFRGFSSFFAVYDSVSGSVNSLCIGMGQEGLYTNATYIWVWSYVYGRFFWSCRYMSKKITEIQLKLFSLCWRRDTHFCSLFFFWPCRRAKIHRSRVTIFFWEFIIYRLKKEKKFK